MSNVATIRERGQAGKIPDTFTASSVAERPAIEKLNEIFREARLARASDVHMENLDDEVTVVRYRIDGELREVCRVDYAMAHAWDNKMRMRALLSTSETRKALDGRFFLVFDGTPLDVRLSILPIRTGHSIVCRLLDQRNAARPLSEIHMEDSVREALGDILEKPNGLLLVTGPTGSGKTTTLYSALGELNSPTRKILTVEDPVEYRLPGAAQVNASGWIGFADALRAMLRQDPNVILVGEIRDNETARISLQAAMTGHLVLSTLHANDAASTLTRLLDLGCDPYTLGTAMRAVMAQRLVRRLCECRTTAPPLPMHARWIKEQDVGNDAKVFGAPVGCEKCNGTGYHGRVPIFEMILADPGVRKGMEAGDKHAIVRAARDQEQFRSLAQSAIILAAEGIIALPEAIAAAGSHAE